MAQGGGTGVPPARPNGEVDDGEEAAVPCDNWILASIYSWVIGGRTKDAMVEKVMTAFDWGLVSPSGPGASGGDPGLQQAPV